MKPQRWLSVLAALCIVLSAATENTYYVGGWQPQDAATVTKMLAPLFQDYLTEAVGRNLEPPAKFVFKPVDLSIESSSRPMIQSDSLHMLYSLSGAIACKAAEFSWVPLATQRNIFGTAITGADAMVVFSRLNNTAVTSVEDLVGKKAAFGFLLSGTTYLAGYQHLTSRGVHPYRDLAQVRFYGTNYEAYFKGVMSGELDVGFTTSSWLVNNHGKEMSQLRILDRQENLTFEGEQYPSVATSLVPTYGLAVSDKFPFTLKRKILEALRSLNASHPALKAMKIAGWGGASSYDIALTALKNTGIAYDQGGKRMCRDPFSRQDIWTSINCPDGYDKVDYNTSTKQCEQAGLACPAGVTCFCRPCVRKPQNLFLWEAVVGLCATLYGVGAFYLCIGSFRDRSRRRRAARAKGFHDPELPSSRDEESGGGGERGRGARGSSKVKDAGARSWE